MNNDLPYALRIPGRHHSRPHYSRVYNFDATNEAEWLDGGEAIEAMLSARPAPLPRQKKRGRSRPAAATVKTVERIARSRKPRVCVDLDGVLAKYEGWKGPEHIGSPISGARDFAWKLAESAEIIVFTSRCSQEAASEMGSKVDPGKMRIRIIDWLEKHGFPYDDVYVGQGKPRASAYIDDRAVPCTPQTDPRAFASALKGARSLLSPRRKRSTARV